MNAVPVMCRRIIGIEAERTLELLFRLPKLPQIIIGKSEGSVRFRKRFIKLKSALCIGFGFGIRLARGRAGVFFQHKVAVGQSDIAESVVRVAVYRLLELSYRFPHPFRGPLVPVVAPS